MYSPEISKELVPKIHSIAKAKRIPMTKVVNEILREALSKIRVETNPHDVKGRRIRCQIKRIN